MYQMGDLLWIPAGTLLQRPRIPGKDDLFSNWHETKSPSVAVFLEHQDNKQCIVVIGGRNWSVQTKNVRHNVSEAANVG